MRAVTVSIVFGESHAGMRSEINTRIVFGGNVIQKNHNTRKLRPNR